MQELVEALVTVEMKRGTIVLSGLMHHQPSHHKKHQPRSKQYKKMILYELDKEKRLVLRIKWYNLKVNSKSVIGVNGNMSSFQVDVVGSSPIWRSLSLQ